MALVALLALLIQTGVGWFVGVRLLRLASRTRELPEFALGSSLLMATGLGYPMLVASAATGSAPLRSSGALLVDVGFMLTAAFTAQVFRPNAGWARGLVAALAVGFLAQLALSMTREHTAGLVQMLLASVVYGWTALEARTRAHMQQRRIALGIGAPALANRLQLWALMGTTSTIAALVNAFTIVFGIMPLEEPAVLVLTTAAGLIQATALWLALAPPTAYLHWVAGARSA
jgi:hypothetical protein